MAVRTFCAVVSLVGKQRFGVDAGVIGTTSLITGGWIPFITVLVQLIQGLHQQVLLELLVAAIHTGSGAPVWSIQEKCKQHQLNQVKPNRPME